MLFSEERSRDVSQRCNLPAGKGLAGGHEHARCLLHICCRYPDALVVRQRFSDKLVERRVIELFPPFGIGGLGRLLRPVPERLRGVDHGTFVVGPHHAAVSTHKYHEKNNQRSAHLSDLPL